MDLIEVGAIVRHPDQPDWGLGQVQSVIGIVITVMFEEVGKQVIHADKVELELVAFDPLNEGGF